MPDGNWGRAFLVAAILTVVGVGAWELYWRSQGYEPTLNDTGDLWSEVRSRISDDPAQTVVIGSSRILFDLDLQAYADHFDTDVPVQLALPGGAPMPMFEYIANLDSFRGTLIIGVTPPLYFVPAGFPIERAEGAIGRYENWSPSQKVGHVLGKILQKGLAFIQQEDLPLNALLTGLDIPNREAAQANIPPSFPPYFQRVEENRQVWMWEGCDFGTPRAIEVQNTWKKLFVPPPPPPGVTPEQAKEGFMKSMEAILERTTEYADKIRARGGRVVFVRCPSSDWVRDLENEMAPRPGFWDRILAAANAPGIHFEDHPELAEFKCPEWSHLTADDAREFTRRLLPHLEQAFSDGGS